MSTPDSRGEHIASIRELPKLLEAAVSDLSDAQLDYQSPADAWTIRQLVHHIADSHLNSFIRMKLLLTEEHPTLKPYDQDAWVQLPDTASTPIQESLAILVGLHARWVRLFEGATEADWHRTAFHPERGDITLDDILETYAAHGAEHIAQIQRIRKAEQW